MDCEPLSTLPGFLMLVGLSVFGNVFIGKFASGSLTGNSIAFPAVSPISFELFGYSSSGVVSPPGVWLSPFFSA